MSDSSSTSDRSVQTRPGTVELSRRGVLQATGAGLAGAGLSGVTGTAGAAGVRIGPLVRDGDMIVDPQGEQVTLRGVNVADPGEQTRDWRGMDAEAVFDMATAHPDWSNTVVRVPLQPEFVAVGGAVASGPAPSDLPHGDEWGPVLPGTFDESALEAYLEAVIDPLVERAEQNGCYLMLVYGRDRGIWHHHEQEAYVNAVGGSPLEDPAYDDLSEVWDCESTTAVDHTVHPDVSEYDAFPTRERAPDVCGERGLLWHGEDQIDEVRETAIDQDVVENFSAVQSADDVYTEPPAICNALDAEVETFWTVVADRYADSDAVLFDVYDEPTGPYAGDWGGPERVPGSLAPVAREDAEYYELWGEYAKPYYDLWIERSQPWMDVVEDNAQGQIQTIGNPRWSQYVYWAPYNEYDTENVCYSSHVQLQENCRPLQKFTGWPAENVPVFFSDFGWMDFDLYVPTPWLDGGIEWGVGAVDPADEVFSDCRGESWSFERFFDETDVHPICSTFDHTRRPNFFDHGEPGTEGDGARGSDHWYDDGHLIEEDTPGAFWQEYVDVHETHVSEGDEYYQDADTGPNELHEGAGVPSTGYHPPVFAGPSCNPPPPPPECPDAADEEVLSNGQAVCDLDGDGEYRDVTADGAVTNSDVTEFFGSQHADPWDSRSDLFDFDGDGEVGQGDVIELFVGIN